MSGKKDTSKLVRKQITDKNGHRKTVWVKRDVSKKSKPKEIKFEEAKYPKHNQFLKTTRIFKDKDGTKHLIHLRSSDGGYLIQTEVFDNLRFNDRTDRYGNKGYYIGAEQGKDGETGFLFLSKKKGQDYYTADAGRADAMKVKEKYRRKGIATAMHKFAEDVLKLKVKPADTLSQDAKGFYGKDKKEDPNKGFTVSHTFNNDKGNKVTQYKIAEGGYARVEEYSDGFVITNVTIEKEGRRKGYATKLYEQANKESIKKTGKTLQSIKADKNGLIELSEDGKALWESFVKKGKAKKIAKNRYRFKDKELKDK